MIFVTGGCFQGKQQWVLQNCQVQPFRVADGAVCSMEAIKSAGVLDHFHLRCAVGCRQAKYRRMRRKRFCQIIRIL